MPYVVDGVTYSTFVECPEHGLQHRKFKSDWCPVCGGECRSVLDSDDRRFVVTTGLTELVTPGPDFGVQVDVLVGPPPSVERAERLYAVGAIGRVSLATVRGYWAGYDAAITSVAEGSR